MKKVGDIVMFKPTGKYGKWFGGKLGTIERISYSKNGKLYFRVRWLEPVKYYDEYTPWSEFQADRFEIWDGGR